MTAPATAEADTTRLAHALLDERVLGHSVPHPEVIETHISCVALTGPYAYKLRKAVQLPFADFRTLESRRIDCEHELALNRRWAPQIYLSVVAIRGSVDAPRLDDDGPIIDYAVKMLQFPHAARLDRVVAEEGIDDALTDALADAVALMHEQAPVATADSPWGTLDAIRAQVQGNLDVLGDEVGTLGASSLRTLEALADTFEARRRQGWVRECHGDLHLTNLARIDGEVVPFDGVEFCADFRWVDVVSDLAFLLMDLGRLDAHVQANRLLNRWLSHTGDFQGLAVLRHYLVYRALVRAKVSRLRLGQLAGDDVEAPDLHERLSDYLELARSLERPSALRGVIITYGLSGSGKSRLARTLAPFIQGIRVRSDVERKRLYPDSAERYAPASTEQVYCHLERIAETVVRADYPVIVDATFLDAGRRRELAATAARLGVPFAILHTHAPPAVLAARVAARKAKSSDASEADLQVLAAQQHSAQPLDENEQRVTVAVDTSLDADPMDAVRRVRALVRPA